jgi:hypothetical protein
MSVFINIKQLKKDLKNVQSNLDMLKGDIGKSSRKALIDTGSKVIEVVKPGVPVLTGVLSSSGRAKPRNDYNLEAGFHTDYAYSQNAYGRNQGYFSDPVRENDKEFKEFFGERFVNYFL